MLEKVQSLAHQRGKLDWVASIDSTIVRMHQHGASLKRDQGSNTGGSALSRLITRSAAPATG